MSTQSDSLAGLMHLLQLADSALPVGGFSFSNTLETAVAAGVVTDAASLEAYAETLVREGAQSDGIAALAAWRAWRREQFKALGEIDRQLLRCKMNAEARLMLCRMGRKLLELAQALAPNEQLGTWLAAVVAGQSPGCHPVVQGALFARLGIAERALFAAQQYGALNLLLSAALRCMRLTHIEAQGILFRAAERIDARYEALREATLDEMACFTPQADILASMHEKGRSRLFMS